MRRFALLGLVVSAGLAPSDALLAQTPEYTVWNYELEPWQGRHCMTSGACLGLTHLYLSAVQHTGHLHLGSTYEYTEYFFAARGFVTGPLPSNFATTITLTGWYDDETRIGFHDSMYIDADGSFTTGGGPNSPCGFQVAYGQIACGGYGPTSNTTMKVTQLDLEWWSLHDYDTQVTARCTKGEPDCYQVPEPNTWALFATGLLGLVLIRRRGDGGALA